MLGTPRLIAWCEAATVDAIADGLDEGRTTVGTNVTIDHLAPTRVGGTVNVVATVVAVDDRRLSFEVEATDDKGAVGRGTVARVVVDRERFVAGLR